MVRIIDTVNVTEDVNNTEEVNIGDTTVNVNVSDTEVIAVSNKPKIRCGTYKQVMWI